MKIMEAMIHDSKGRIPSITDTKKKKKICETDRIENQMFSGRPSRENRSAKERLHLIL